MLQLRPKNQLLKQTNITGKIEKTTELENEVLGISQKSETVMEVEEFNLETVDKISETEDLKEINCFI